MAVVVPWASSRTSPSQPADKPRATPSAWFPGVVGTLMARGARPSTCTTTSVNVPPTSTPAQATVCDWASTRSPVISADITHASSRAPSEGVGGAGGAGR